MGCRLSSHQTRGKRDLVFIQQRAIFCVHCVSQLYLSARPSIHVYCGSMHSVAIVHPRLTIANYALPADRSSRTRKLSPLIRTSLKQSLTSRMAPGKGLEPLRARRPTGSLVIIHLGPFFFANDLEASAITAPPPRHCLELLNCAF